MMRIFQIAIILCISGRFLSQAQDLDFDADYNFKHENYVVALEQYQKLLRRDPNDPELHYRIGICYLNTNINKAEAIKYFEFASRFEKSENLILYDLGRAYFYGGFYDKAIEIFTKYREFMKDEPEVLKIVDKWLEFCQNARHFTADTLNISFINLGDDINSDRADFNPLVTPDESIMVYTTDRKYERDLQEHIHYIYQSETKNSRWKRGKTAGREINSDNHDICTGLSADAEILLFNRGKYTGDNDIFFAARIRRRYREPTRLSREINSAQREGGACLNANLDILYFSSEQKEGTGGMDLYFSRKLPTGVWGPPQSLGDIINTPYDENYPKLSDDGKILYFASKGHNSMGGYDIFMSRWNDRNKQWTKPVNMGFPINDTYDNTIISFVEDPRYAYIAAVRPGGMGSYDIYRVVFKEKEASPVIYNGFIAVGDSLENRSIHEADTNITMQVINKAGNTVFGKYKPSKGGKYTIALPPGEYILKVKGKSYQPWTKEIKIEEGYYKNRLRIMNIYLQLKSELE